MPWRSAVRAASDTGWSGEVRSLGSLRVPVDDAGLRGVAGLLGQETNLRVWWRGPDSWRVDRMRRGGESDLAVDDGLAVRWESESRKVSVTPYSRIRLPHAVDVLPVNLAQRLLAGATSSELSRLPSRRIAGRSAAGLRLTPADSRSTISRVDLWADDESAVPLRVEVYDDQSRRAVLVTRVTSFDDATPTARSASLNLAPGLSFSRGVSFDDALEQNAFAPFMAPGSLAGLERAGDVARRGGIGVYGRGPTAFLVIPVRDSVAGELAAQLRRSRSARDDGRTIALEVGPISMLLVDHGEENRFLIAGTVTPETLLAASQELGRDVR